MIRKKIFILLFILASNLVYAQITFIDSINNSKIPYVEIYSDRGVLIERANQRGIISDRELNKLKSKNYKKFYLYQISYEAKVITINELFNLKEIFLSPKTYNLSEIRVMVKAKKKIPYLRISGIFRGYQFSNDNIKYYINGEVENYLFLNKKKKQKRIIKAYKSWVNLPYIQKQLSKKILVRPAPPSNIVLRGTRKTLLNVFSDIDANIENKPESTSYIVLDKYNKKIGEISIDTNLALTKIYYKFLDRDDEPETTKLFGFTVSDTYSITYEFYRAKNLKDIKYQNLLYVKQVYYTDYSHRKEKVMEKIKTIREFFVTDVSYAREINKTNISDLNFYKESNYSYPFWENINSKLYQPLPESVEKALGTTLIELGNIQKNK